MPLTPTTKKRNFKVPLEQPFLSNLDKIYWPEEKISKGDLIKYYESVAGFILPYLKNRPLSLLRHPNGIKAKSFFHKDAGNIAPSWMRTADIYSESSYKTVHYLVCNDLKSLLFIANLGCIEMNPWNSTINSPDHPDYLIMDIDPSEKNNFNEVIEVALVIKEMLDKGKISGYCKTSGATGMHVYIPCNRMYKYEECREFARIIAIMTHEQLPALTTLERSLSKRKKNHVYIDYLQNSRGQTLASAYSVRPKPGATVSTPLDWKEVKYGLSPSDFTIKNVLKRFKKKGDLFKTVLGKGVDMEKALSLFSKKSLPSE
jgi:bifunctional non-homologous end joining protein LigD